MALNINNFVTFNETVKLTIELKGWVGYTFVKAYIERFKLKQDLRNYS